MKIKNSKIFKLISSLIIGMIALFNSTQCFAFVATTQRKYTPLERVIYFLEDHVELLGVALGLVIIIYYFIKLRKNLDEAKKDKKEYPSEEKGNPVAKELKDIEKGYIIDYCYTFMMGLIIIILSILINY